MNTAIINRFLRIISLRLHQVTVVKAMAVIALVLLYVGVLAQVNISVPRGGSATFFFEGTSGACVTTAPTKGNLRFNFGSDCGNTNQDPIFIQNACQCCPIFRNDCFRYTNTNVATTTDMFVIGGITYNVTITGNVLFVVPGGSVTFFFGGTSGACVTTAPTRGNLRFNFGSDCGNTNQDPIFIQSACQCCPIFRNDCFRYTNTVPSATFDYVVIGSENYLINITTQSTVPVTLTGIKAYRKNTEVQVEWATAQESDVDRYELERSGIAQPFTKIASVPSQGNSTMGYHYQLTDPTPLGGSNNYRLKTIDLSGDITYSRVVSVDIDGKPDIIIAPNPVIGHSMALKLMHLNSGSYIITVTNKFGQQVVTRKIRHSGGTIMQAIELPGSLATGMYVLNISGEGISINKQFTTGR